MNPIENLIYSHMHPIEQLTISLGSVDQKNFGVSPSDGTRPYVKQAKFKICPNQHNLDRLGQFICDQAETYFKAMCYPGDSFSIQCEFSVEKVNFYLRKLIAQKKNQGSMPLVEGLLRLDLSLELLEPTWQQYNGDISYDIYSYPENRNFFSVPTQSPVNLSLFNLHTANEKHKPSKTDVCIYACGDLEDQSNPIWIRQAYPDIAGFIIVDDLDLKSFLNQYDIDPSLLNPGE